MYYPPVENSLWRQFVSQLEKMSSDKIICGLLFLLPIFAVTVRHWVSDIFGLLSIISLILLYRRGKGQQTLAREEKTLLWGFAVYFGVFILTSIVNGWTNPQTRSLGVEIRFLLFIPLYLVIRQMSGATKWLITGSIFGVIFTAYDGARDIFLNDIGTYRGVYSPLFTGPITLVLASLLISYFYVRTDRKWVKWSLLLIGCLAFFVVSETGARNAYLAAIILGMLLIVHQYKGAMRYTLIGAIFVIAYMSYLFVPTVNDRLNIAYTEYTNYLANENPAIYKGPSSSVGIRLEMWRVTPLFFKDHPLFGIGSGNYSAKVRKYIDAGLVNPNIGKHGHPHNIYSEAIISKGSIGFISLLWITVYPLFILVRDYRRNVPSAFYGIVLITAYMILSLTDASTLIKGNYSAIYVVFLVVLFSYHMHEKRKQSIT